MCAGAHSPGRQTNTTTAAFAPQSSISHNSLTTAPSGPLSLPTSTMVVTVPLQANQALPAASGGAMGSNPSTEQAREKTGMGRGEIISLLADWTIND